MWPSQRYRAENAALRADLTAAIGQQFVFLNLSDLDGSWASYSRMAGEAVAATGELASLTAIDTFRAWLIDEVGEAMAEQMLAGTVAIDLAEVQAMLNLKGPIEIKRLIGAGWKPEDAWLSAMRQTANVARGYAHAAGQRSLLGAFADYGSVLQGWKRNIAPSACSFCRKLERVVYHPSARWEKPHDGCGCTAEPVANNARVPKYVSPLERARNESLRQAIARRKDRERERFAASLPAAA